MKQKKRRKFTKKEIEAAKTIFASMGGRAISKKIGGEGMAERGRNGAEIRWGKKKKK